MLKSRMKWNFEQLVKPDYWSGCLYCEDAEKWKLRHDFLPDKNGVRVSETKDCLHVDLEQIGGLLFEVLIK